jgi:hypothetical protein
LRGIEDLGLHYVKTGSSKTIGHVDVGYKYDVSIDKSQTGYIFFYSNAPINWKSVKQTVTTTSTNHSELIAFQEATREVVWFRNLHMFLITKTGLNTPINPTIIYEDNATCVAQVGAGFIKNDRVKHIDPHIFNFTQELITSGQLQVQNIKFPHNIVDLLTSFTNLHSPPICTSSWNETFT